MSDVRVSSRAQRDLIESIEYLFSLDPNLAEDFLGLIERAYEAIGEEPRRYARLETNRTDREVRRLRIERFRYLVIYELIGDEVFVLSIMHTSRHPDAWQ